MDRRKFFQITAVGAAATCAASTAQAAENYPPIPGAVGMLYDSTLCVGCQACVASCQKLNGNPRSDRDAETHAPHSDNNKLSVHTNTVIQVWSDGAGTNKDQEEDGYAFIKKACMHCVTPNCVIACPVTALVKDPKTGVIHYDPDVCTGCRNCMVACPYNVPQYDYNHPFGLLYKCEFCNQKGLERLDKGLLPGCVEACPAGAIIFGTREELLEEAKRRLALKPGEMYSYPRLTLDSGDTHQHKVANYQQHIYGEKEGGGTQVMVLSAVPHQNLGLPELEDLSTGARTAHLQHTLYKGLVLPAAALACITAFVWRNERKANQDQGQGGHHE